MTTVGTKIEKKIASNGVEMFFAIDENGKKTRISRKDAIIPFAYQVREQLKAEREAAMLEAVISPEAQEIAINAEIELATATVDEVTEKFTTVKADNAEQAVEILDELNFRHVTFEYHGDTNEYGKPVVYRHFDGIDSDGNGTCFGLIEIVINGKLDTVSFINNYRETAVDIKIGDAKYTVGEKGEVILTEEPDEVTEAKITDDDKLAELFQVREEKRRAARHSSFDSDESKAARDANRFIEEFISKVVDKKKKAAIIIRERR